MGKRNALQLVLVAFLIVYSIILTQTRLASLHSKVALLDQSHVAAADMRLQVSVDPLNILSIHYWFVYRAC